MIFRILITLACIVSACATQIGDECDYDTECPAGAYCDSTMPGGMCTESPCRPGECPSESVCVEFDNGQSYCMASCESDGDCRDGYVCVKDVGPYPFCSVEE